MCTAIGHLKSLMNRSAPALLLACLCLVLTAGCTGPLKVNYTPRPDHGAVAQSPAEGPPSIFIAGITDERSAGALKNPRRIGRIDATVFDINSSSLTIADDPATLVSEALAKEFASAGYEVKPERAGADFILDGELKAFSFDILFRDHIDIELTASVKRTDTGETIWSGAPAEKSSRYAGVSGNSKASIERYINASLAKVTGAVVDGATAEISATRAVAAPEEGKPSVQKTAPTAPKTTGTMSIETEPERAKVYIGGVYYGLTPMTLELDPGIYELEIRQKGYKDGAEKVSVRKGEKTEVEMELAGE